MKHFVVIDMQNDFCTGALPNKEAVAAIPFIKARLKEAKSNGDNIIFTRDTHFSNYLETNEGKHLPIPHCISGTKGWEIVPELMKETDENTVFIDKLHFGYDNWENFIKEGDEVVMVGTCTDICVISNALALKQIDDVEVTVLAEGCAGLNPTLHEQALFVMGSCQVKVIDNYDAWKKGK